MKFFFHLPSLRRTQNRRILINQRLQFGRGRRIATSLIFTQTRRGNFTHLEIGCENALFSRCANWADRVPCNYAATLPLLWRKSGSFVSRGFFFHFSPSDRNWLTRREKNRRVPLFVRPTSFRYFLPFVRLAVNVHCAHGGLDQIKR